MITCRAVEFGGWSYVMYDVECCGLVFTAETERECLKWLAAVES